MTCVNCQYEHDHPFCPNCGEKSQTPKITFRSIFNDGFSTVTNMDKGFLFNIKNLSVNQNKTVNDYINGKRKNILNPISFLVIAITIYLIVDSLITVKGDGIDIDSQVYCVGYEAGKFLKSYFKYFWILSIIWLGISTKLIFGKYNYAEHLAISSFIIGQSTLLGLPGLLISKVGLLFNPLVYISIIWMAYQIFKRKERDWDILLQALAATVVFFIQLVLIVVLIGVIRC